jgi:hypothetical protein
MIKKFLLPLLFIAGLIGPGCKKNSSGPPSITSVRVIDTARRDSVFTRATPGTEIVINGTNLGGLQEVLFNDTSAFFNPVYATSSHIIVTIPGSAPTAAANPSVPNTIRLVTDHGTTTYSFTLYLSSPYINSITLDNSGTIVTINGGNFQGIKKITFPVAGADTALSYTVNKSFNQIIAAIPPGAPFNDSLRVICTYGIATYQFPPPMIIKSVSNENAMAGASITINGTNFIGVARVIFPGGIEGIDLQSVSVDQLTVTVPPGITAPDLLRIEGVLGNASSSQLFDSYITHPSPGYLSTFDVQYNGDNTGFVGWTGGYAGAPVTDYPNATGSVAFLRQGSPMPGSTSAGSQGNAGFVQLNPVPWVSNTGTPVAGYSLKFEVYVAQPWSAGAIYVLMGGWYGWRNYVARYAPWSSTEGGTFQPAGWVTATIPLTQFASFSGNGWDLKAFPSGAPATKFSDFSATDLCFAIVNDQPSPDIPANTLNIAIDNIRIVKGQ